MQKEMDADGEAVLSMLSSSPWPDSVHDSHSMFDCVCAMATLGDGEISFTEFNTWWGSGTGQLDNVSYQHTGNARDYLSFRAQCRNVAAITCMPVSTVHISNYTLKQNREFDSP